MDGATEVHWKNLLKTIKYVVKTKYKVLFMKPDLDKEEWKIKGYSDSDYAGDKNNRISITGYIIYIMNAPVAWRSKSQRSVTLSSSEAEYVALSETTAEVMFIKQILEFLQVKLSLPIEIKVDNIGAC